MRFDPCIQATQTPFALSKTARAVALIALATLAPAGTALADPGEPLTRKVEFGDLNLERPDGIARLYARLEGAAEAVCHPLNGSSLRERMLWRDCVSDAVGNAVAELDRPALTARHLAKTGTQEQASKPDVAKRP
jgi:UrcA family protein